MLCRSLCSSGAALLLLLTLPCLAQAPAGAPPTAPLSPATGGPSAPASQTQPGNQLIDLFAANAKTGAADATLGATDLEILDDNKPVSISSILTPTQPGRRPVVLWLVVQCVTTGDPNNGSGFLRPFTADLASGLTRLQPGEAFGVAHWCDDGSSAIDLAPSRHITAAGATVAHVLASTISPPNNPFLGENALLKVLHDTKDATAQFNPDALPALVFLYGDHSAGNARDVAKLAAELLGPPAVVFLVNNGLASPPRGAFSEIPSVIGHLVVDTGGFYSHPPFGDHDPLIYAEAVAEVLANLHSRYQLAWHPSRSDLAEHTLSVRLSQAARKSHPGLVLRARSYYVSAPSVSAR